jgi:hypothetical protein
MGKKVEVELADLEALLELADDYVYWKASSLALAERIETVIKEAYDKKS